MIYAFLWAFFYSISNTIAKYVSVKFDLFKSLFFQNIILAIFGFMLIYFFDSFKIDYKANYIYFLLIWLSWFIWTWTYYLAMKHINNWIVLVIANLYVFWSYFLNNYLIWDIEKFSWVKIIISLLFFIIITFFIFERNKENELKFNSKIIYALVTAFCWVIYSSYRNYTVKAWIFSPFQWMFYSQLFVGIIAFISFLIKSIIDKKIDVAIELKQIISYIWVSIFMFIWSICFFLWYKSIWWNYVNIIALIQIPFLTLFSFIFLKDTLTKKQIITILSAVLVLILFVTN